MVKPDLGLYHFLSFSLFSGLWTFWGLRFANHRSLEVMEEVEERNPPAMLSPQSVMGGVPESPPSSQSCSPAHLPQVPGAPPLLLCAVGHGLLLRGPCAFPPGCCEGKRPRRCRGRGQISFILAGWLASSPACPDLRPDLGTSWGLSDPIGKAQGQGALYGPGALSVFLLRVDTKGSGSCYMGQYCLFHLTVVLCPCL